MAFIDPAPSQARRQLEAVPAERFKRIPEPPLRLRAETGLEPERHISRVELGVGNVEPTVRKMEHVRVGDDTELLTYRDLDLQGRFQGLVQVASYEAVVGIREEVLRDIGDPHR